MIPGLEHSVPLTRSTPRRLGEKEDFRVGIYARITSGGMLGLDGTEDLHALPIREIPCGDSQPATALRG